MSLLTIRYPDFLVSSVYHYKTPRYVSSNFPIIVSPLDVLPFIGTGVVLVPMALWQLLNGHYVRMAVCLLLYAACIVIREFLEPKLIGNRMGIAPVLMLLAIYAGIRLFGVGGIIKGPLALIVIYELNKA